MKQRISKAVTKTEADHEIGERFFKNPGLVLRRIKLPALVWDVLRIWVYL